MSTYEPAETDLLSQIRDRWRTRSVAAHDGDARRLTDDQRALLRGLRYAI